jgi:hypothetical protein
MNVGFTGTRFGMSELQKQALYGKLTELKEPKQSQIYAIIWEEFHHGDCVGADAEAHAIALTFRFKVVIHPPDQDKLRAFCKTYSRLEFPRPYLERNKIIVDSCNLLIAAPRTNGEKLRSGTWSTIRYAKHMKKEVYILPRG